MDDLFDYFYTNYVKETLFKRDEWNFHEYMNDEEL